ncbi:hypothetical protein AK812_SmicGene44546, partial [Symbiodinium microadriaticum]
MRFRPGRDYSDGEVEWMVARHLCHPSTSLMAAVAAELRRRGFLQDVPGGTRLSVEGVRWVLDGDKLFRSRKADAASGKAWWQLPLNSQHVLLAEGLIAGEQTRTYRPEPSGGVPMFDAFRCVLLGAGKEVVLQFRCASGPVPTSPGLGTFSEAGDCFACVEHAVSAGDVCVECTVTSEDRLPPFRLDGRLGGSWLVLWCQPMPTPE